MSQDDFGQVFFFLLQLERGHQLCLLHIGDRGIHKTFVLNYFIIQISFTNDCFFDLSIMKPYIQCAVITARNVHAELR